MFYLFSRRDMPGPGAQAFALTTYQLPNFDSTGGGKQYGGDLSFGNKPTVMNGAYGQVSGYGGIMAGTMVMQPLTDLSAVGVPSEAYLTGDGS